ncbi:MAG: DUF1499 domain-containing protein, partial [Pseudomonadales bacterium]|nr:DUF1499 domain-containing protein [Pseudomonadales bacterium]
MKSTEGKMMGSIDRNQIYKAITTTLVTATLAACAGSPPDYLGVHNGRLAACPSTPNCVSSYAHDKDARIAPFRFAGSAADAQEKLVRILNKQDNVKIVVNKRGYVRTEFSSSFMGFVDDVEFVIEPELIHVRSASRLGYSDL